MMNVYSVSFGNSIGHKVKRAKNEVDRAQDGTKTDKNVAENCAVGLGGAATVAATRGKNVLKLTSNVAHKAEKVGSAIETRTNCINSILKSAVASLEKVKVLKPVVFVAKLPVVRKAASVFGGFTAIAMGVSDFANMFEVLPNLSWDNVKK